VRCHVSSRACVCTGRDRYTCPCVLRLSRLRSSRT
jgi:hypothetical protein